MLSVEEQKGTSCERERVLGAAAMTDRVVQFSGGAGSWAAARRVVDRFGPEDVTLLCADTRSEHADWRGFVEAAATDLGCRLVVVDAGRDIWALAMEQHAIPSTRMAFCSRILKHEQLDAWRDAHCDPADTTLYVGIDWTEERRLKDIRARVEPWPVEAPLLWEPLADKAELIAELESSGLPFPTAYQLGLPHNNCLTFGCVKGGQAYWERLLRLVPDAFARSEAAEDEFRAEFGDYSILRDRRGGTTKVLPLRVFRERIQAQPSLFDDGDFGDCGCL